MDPTTSRCSNATCPSTARAHAPARSLATGWLQHTSSASHDASGSVCTQHVASPGCGSRHTALVKGTPGVMMVPSS